MAAVRLLSSLRRGASSWGMGGMQRSSSGWAGPGCAGVRGCGSGARSLSTSQAAMMAADDGDDSGAEEMAGVDLSGEALDSFRDKVFPTHTARVKVLQAKGVMPPPVTMEAGLSREEVEAAAQRLATPKGEQDSEQAELNAALKELHDDYPPGTKAMKHAFPKPEVEGVWPKVVTKPPLDDDRQWVARSELPTKEEYLKKAFFRESDYWKFDEADANQEEVSGKSPDDMTPEEFERHSAQAWEELQSTGGKWRMDQVRLADAPLWMQYEHAEGTMDADDEVDHEIIKPDMRAVIRVPQRDSKQRAYATGKRKTAVARVWIKEGDGKFTVNRREFVDYFDRSALRAQCLQPFVATQTCGAFDVWLTVQGGGLAGQAGAIRHGVAKALANYDPFLRPLLKREKLLRRDPRMVERKKPGQPKARKKFQWVKR